jgi:hypothetical protein
MLDQLLEPMGDAGGIAGVRPGDILEISGDAGIAEVDIGEDGFAALPNDFSVI